MEGFHEGLDGVEGERALGMLGVHAKKMKAKVDEQLNSTIANELNFCPFIRQVFERLDAFEARRQKREQAAAAAAPRVC